MTRLFVTQLALFGSLIAFAPESALLNAQAAVPALRYAQASGCGGLFLYAWNEDRSEVMTIRIDQRVVKLPDGTTSLNIAKSGSAIEVRVELTDGPRGTMPFCSEEGAGAADRPTVWTATAGTVKAILRHRPNAAFTPVSIEVDDLVVRSPDGREVKGRRTIRFTAAVSDFTP